MSTMFNKQLLNCTVINHNWKCWNKIKWIIIYRNTNLPNSIRNKSLPQLCSRNSGRSRPQSSGDGLTKTLIKQRPLVQSRSTDCIKKTENPKNNTKTKNLNGIEKNPTNSNKPIVKECKKKLKRLEEESLSDKSEPNVFSNISNHSINFMHEKLKQKVLTKTVSKEKIRSVDMTLRQESFIFSNIQFVIISLVKF